MRKMASLVLALVLILSASVSVCAAPFYLEYAGVTIEVPEGMTGQDMSDGAVSMLGITVDDDPNLKFAYAVFYVDELEGKWLEDLSDVEAQGLGLGIAQSIANPEVDYAEIDGYSVLVVVSGDAAQLHYISLLNGWICDVAAGRDDGALSENDMLAAAQLLDSITFDGAEE